MRLDSTSRTFIGALGVSLLALVVSLALACGRDTSSQSAAPRAQVATVEAAPVPASASGAPEKTPASTPAGLDAAPSRGGLTFTGDREETERFIRYYQQIPLTPEQERIKVEALAAIPAPCCAENPLATCCCPCNMAKAAWGMSAWLITEKGYGMEQVRQAAKDWLAATNPDGFTGDACRTGGCMRPIHENGCGGMDESQVL